MIPASRSGPKSSTPGGTLGTIGAYQLIEMLPGTHEVRQYRARQRGPGGFERLCSLKLAARKNSDLRPAESLEREAKIMMRLDHPNIVRFHDFFEHEGDVVLVFEHFSGLTLARLLEVVHQRGEKLDERAALHISRCLFEALAHAHGLVDLAGEPTPTVHRDVRPGNILLASDGRVRLTGFSAAQGGAKNEEVTAFGAVFTVPSYVAPEQAHGGKVTERSDAFAAALVVWELLTGRSGTPEGLSEFDLLKALAYRSVEPLRALRPDIPALVATAIDTCLKEDPFDRSIPCAEVAGCIALGFEVGDGAEVLRATIASLGPAIENLAGGKSMSGPASRRSDSLQATSHRPEAPTLHCPDQVSVKGTSVDHTAPNRPSGGSKDWVAADLIRPAAGSMDEETVKTGALKEPPVGIGDSELTEVTADLIITELEDEASAAATDSRLPDGLDDDSATLVRPGLGFPAVWPGSAASYVVTSSQPDAVPDGDFVAFQAAAKRRNATCLAIVSIPVVITWIIVALAVVDATCGPDTGAPATSKSTPASAPKLVNKSSLE